MTKDEILEKSKRDYPIGTVFLEKTRDKEFTVNNYYYKESNDTLYSESIHQGGGAIYRDGVWSKIVSSPKQDSSESLVGRYVKKIKSDQWDYQVKEGEYDIILTEEKDRYNLKKGFAYYKDGEKGSIAIFSKYFQIMPKDFNPLKQESNMEEKWKIGGYVKITKEVWNALPVNSIGIVRTKSLGTIGISTLTDDYPWSYNPLNIGERCEWIGMTKPEIPSSNIHNLQKGKFYSCTYDNKTTYFLFNKINGNYIFTDGWRWENTEWTDKSCVNTYYLDMITNLTKVDSNTAKGITVKQEENLVGRYLKVLKGGYGGHKYLEIEKSNTPCQSSYSNNTWLTKELRGEWMSLPHRIDSEKELELMPIGFKPEQEEPKFKKEEKVPELPSYVECTNSSSWNGTYREYNCKGVIYKTSQLPSWCNGWKLETFWKAFYPSNFKESTFIAFQEQEMKNQFQTDAKSLEKYYDVGLVKEMQGYVMGADPYQDIIEIGDEIEVTKGTSWFNLGYKSIVKEIDKDKFLKLVNGYWIEAEKVKLIKKRSPITNNYTEKLDISSAKVGNEYTINIVIPKSPSITLKNIEKEVKINVKIQKTVKI